MKSTNDLLAVLSRHIGQDNGISVKALAAELDISERGVRKLVTEMRMDGAALCGTPKSGYYIAANKEELQKTIDFMKHRAMHTLTLVSRMGKVPMPDLHGQLHIPT